MKDLSVVISALKHAAEKFRATSDLRERAQLLVELRDQLVVPENVERSTRDYILSFVNYHGNEAARALHGEGTYFLETLLIHMGDKRSDKNDLEKLIDTFESSMESLMT